MDLANQDTAADAAVASLITELRQLNTDLQVPSPRSYGIEKDKYFSLLSIMAEQALASGSPNNNPRVPSAEDITQLYREAWNA